MEGTVKKKCCHFIRDELYLCFYRPPGVAGEMAVCRTFAGIMAVQDKMRTEPTPHNAEKSKEKQAIAANGLVAITMVSSESKALAAGELTTTPDDPWVVSDLLDQDHALPWAEISTGEKLKRASCVLLKLLALCGLLYVFFCSLDFLSSSFRLLGGKTAGEFFRKSEHLKNPVVGLMLGILATVLVQSSSTSTSIIVTMVASNFLTVETAIPIVMGANIGTSVTNTLVSLAQSSDRNEFRRAFAGATVHDMFNWGTVIVLLPLEVATGYLYHLTNALVDGFEWKTNSHANKELLQVITKPFTDLIIQLDKKVINGVALGDETYTNKSLIKEWCKFENTSQLINVTMERNLTDFTFDVQTVNVTETKEIFVKFGTQRCNFIFNNTGLGDTWVGLILLCISLVLLCTCLVLMVKVLHSMLRGSMASIVRKTLNSDLPGRWAFLTGYVALALGCGMTILVQSSSIFTSALTPLVGLGVISVERMYPLTLGSNIGTTTTSLLASLAASGNELRSSIQIALCHLFFNITGILLFYPVPVTRVPIRLAKGLGNITAKYRWFSVIYLVFMFILIPAFVFSVSMAGILAMAVVLGVITAIIVAIGLVNILQKKKPECLPPCLRTWQRFPKCLRSLEPWDRVIVGLTSKLGSYCVCCKCLGSDKNLPGHGKTHCTKTECTKAAGLTPNSSGNRLCISSAPSLDGIDNPMVKNPVTSSV